MGSNVIDLTDVFRDLATFVREHRCDDCPHDWTLPVYAYIRATLTRHYRCRVCGACLTAIFCEHEPAAHHTAASEKD